MRFDYSQMFSQPVFRFLDSKAKSRFSLIESLVLSIMTILFLHLHDDNHVQALNLFTMSVGHPGTGKSPALKIVLSTVRVVECILKATIDSSTTSSGLVKTLS